MRKHCYTTTLSAIALALLAGCSSLNDVDRAKVELANGQTESGIVQLEQLSDKGYHEAQLSLGNHYLMQTEQNELLKAQQWYSALLPFSDKAKLGYARWLAKVSHIDPSIRPLTKQVLTHRQQHSRDIGVELSRFIQEYYPQEQSMIAEILETLQQDTEIEDKEILRVLDSLVDPKRYQSLLDSLCETNGVDFDFYCIRSYVRLFKLHAIGDIEALVKQTHQAYQDQKLTTVQLVSIAELIGSDNSGDGIPLKAQAILQPHLHQVPVLLSAAKVALRYPDVLPVEPLLADLNSLAEQGNPTANLYLARLYLQKAESRTNLQAAFEHLQRATTLPEGKYRLGSLILSGKLIDLPEQYTDQFAIDTIVEAGRALYLNAYGFLAEYFSDQKHYVYDPVYAKVFATVYMELGGFVDEQRNYAALVNQLVLGDYDQRRVDDTVKRELTYGIEGWQPIAVSEKDLAILLGES